MSRKVTDAAAKVKECRRAARARLGARVGLPVSAPSPSQGAAGAANAINESGKPTDAKTWAQRGVHGGRR